MNKSLSEMITITKAKYKELMERSNFLYALEAAGVDNWVGYEEAQNLLEEWANEVIEEGMEDK